MGRGRGCGVLVGVSVHTRVCGRGNCGGGGDGNCGGGSAPAAAVAIGGHRVAAHQMPIPAQAPHPGRYYSTLI